MRLQRIYPLLILLILIVSSTLSAVLQYNPLLRIDEEPEMKLLAQTTQPTPVLEVVESYNIYNRGSNPFNLSDLGDLYVTYPQIDLRQVILDYKVYVAGKLVGYTVKSEYGNLSLVAIVNVDDIVIDPGKNVSIKVYYKVKIKPPPKPISIDDILNASWYTVSSIKYYNNLTAPSRFWNYSNPLIKLLSDYLWEKSNGNLGLYLIEAVRWIRENIAYRTRVPARHPVEVLAEYRGDCDDDANLLITLLRAKGIPAILEAGLVYIKGYYGSTLIDHVVRYEIRNGGPHGWVKVYIPGLGWRPIDLTFILTGSKDPIDAFNEGAYMKMPIVIVERSLGKDYASETVEETRKLEKLEAYLVARIELNVVEG